MLPSISNFSNFCNEDTCTRQYKHSRATRICLSERETTVESCFGFWRGIKKETRFLYLKEIKKNATWIQAVYYWFAQVGLSQQAPHFPKLMLTCLFATQKLMFLKFSQHQLAWYYSICGTRMFHIVIKHPINCLGFGFALSWTRNRLRSRK